MSETPLSDSAARELAQTCFERPLLVEAGAGTGKTAALVARVVVWALGPGWETAQNLENAQNSPAARRRDAALRSDGDAGTAVRALSGIVAITFTEAAAAEMATRIALDLAKIASGATPAGYFAKAPLPPEETRRARARELIGALDHLTVRTIHAFCRRLLAAHPLEAGLHPDLEVDPDAIRADAIAREVIEARLAAVTGAGLDRDLAALADAGIGPKALHEALVKLLAEGARPEDLAEELLGEGAVCEFARDVAELARGIAEIEGGELARTQAKQGARLCERLRLLERELGASAAAGMSLADLASHAAADWSEDIDKLGKWARGDFGKAEGVCFAERQAEVAAYSRRLRDGLRQLGKLDPHALSAARRLLHEMLSESTRRMRAAGVATFGSLLRDAHALLHEHPEVAARVRSEIQQLLVDEFQDTDALQCEIVEALAFAGGPRPALFLVGDPKQSIYGWRNADLAAYEAMRARVLAEGGEVARLVVNRRSVPAVLGEVARLLEPVMLEAKGLQPAYQGLEVHPERALAAGAAGPGQAAVEHWLSFARGADGAIEDKNPVGRANRLEGETLARDLVRLRASGVALGKVGVLLRTTTAFEPVLGALRRVGIPFVVERETRHGERRELVEARAFLRCVLDPHDQLALVAALRAPAVGVPDAALVPLWQRSFPKLVAELTPGSEAQLEALHAVAHEAALAMPQVPGGELLAGFEASLAAFLHGLAALRRSFASESPERFVERLREVWLLEPAEASRFLGVHRVASVDRLLRDLVGALEDADGSAAGLLSALHRSGTIAREHEEGRPRALAGDAVQVMTIHRAKGLEFEHVYLLQGHREDRKPAEKETRVYRGRGRRAFELLGMPSPGAWQARVEQDVVEAHERVRLLYVAATRARERLVIGWSRKLGAAPEPENARSLADLLTNRGDPRVQARNAIDAGGAFTDAHGVLWRALAWQDAPPLPRAEITLRPIDPARLERDEQFLRAKRSAAEAREARAWHATASEFAHATSEEREAPLTREQEAAEEPASECAAEPPDRERRTAMAAGTAVHAALEHARLDAEPREIAAAGEAALAAALAALEPASERAAAAQRARARSGSACARASCSRACACSRRASSRASCPCCSRRANCLRQTTRRWVSSRARSICCIRTKRASTWSRTTRRTT